MRLSGSRGVALVLRALSDTLLARGRLEEAEEACRRALRIRQDRSGEDNPSTASVLCDLAAIERHQGEVQEAIRAAREAHRICQRLGTAFPALRMTAMA